MPLRLHQNVDQRTIVKVAMVEVGGDTALEQRASFLDFFPELVEQGIPFDAANDLLLVVEGQITRDGACEATSGFFGLNQRHPAETPSSEYRCFLPRLSKESPGRAAISSLR